MGTEDCWVILIAGKSGWPRNFEVVMCFHYVLHIHCQEKKSTQKCWAHIIKSDNMREKPSKCNMTYNII